ncbi:MAG: pimeloyl-[acyl-carrier protein] methyl ester esterase [Pseudomonadota bacterium]|nr:pimeloyl-[acyl-carrier protein] methyl ester esterase [Pseudomonadota bacterium]
MSEKQPLCVFVHGWGMNRAVWQPVIESLPEWIESVAVDLPGHGTAADKNFSGLDDLVMALCRDITRPAIWIGWSLGGLAVLKLALDHPSRVQAMMLVSSTPCFVRRDDWPCGMPHTLFDGFAAELAADYENTIRRFLSLQVKDSAQGRQLLKQLRQKVLQQPAANIHALHSGLEILKKTDLREPMQKIEMPLAVVLGARDGLVSAESSKFFTDNFAHADVQIYAQAAHAPFLSHLPDFAAQLVQLVSSLHDKSA